MPDSLPFPSQLAAVEGDGYKHGYSPHTPAEEFQGITLGRAGLVRKDELFGR